MLSLVRPVQQSTAVWLSSSLLCSHRSEHSRFHLAFPPSLPSSFPFLPPPSAPSPPSLSFSCSHVLSFYQGETDIWHYVSFNCRTLQLNVCTDYRAISLQGIGSCTRPVSLHPTSPDSTASLLIGKNHTVGRVKMLLPPLRMLSL